MAPARVVVAGVVVPVEMVVAAGLGGRQAPTLRPPCSPSRLLPPIRGRHRTTRRRSRPAGCCVRTRRRRSRVPSRVPGDGGHGRQGIIVTPWSPAPKVRRAAFRAATAARSGTSGGRDAGGGRFLARQL